MLLLALAGCNPYPEVRSPEAITLMTALRTACNTRNADRLGRVTAAVAEAHTAGRLDESEHAAFQEIVAEAEAGRWEDAERACVDFQRAQVR